MNTAAISFGTNIHYQNKHAHELETTLKVEVNGYRMDEYLAAKKAFENDGKHGDTLELRVIDNDYESQYRFEIGEYTTMPVTGENASKKVKFQAYDYKLGIKRLCDYVIYLANQGKK